MKTLVQDLDLRLITESKKFRWYVSSIGTFFRYCPGINKWQQIYGYTKNDTMVIKIKCKEYIKSRVVAKHFIKGYNAWQCVGFKDKNNQNIQAENLYMYSMKVHGKRTGWKSRSKEVIIKEFKQEPVIFRSVREAAKYLFCSYQTLLDYLTGEVKKSVLDKPRRKIYYK
jgi:hypothetical protein